MHSREIACFSTIRGMEDACHAPMESGQPTAVLHFFPVGFGRRVSKRISFTILVPAFTTSGKLVTEGALANGMRRYALYLGVGGFPHFYPIKSAIFLRIAPPPTVMYMSFLLLKRKVTNTVVIYIVSSAPQFSDSFCDTVSSICTYSCYNHLLANSYYVRWPAGKVMVSQECQIGFCTT